MTAATRDLASGAAAARAASDARSCHSGSYSLSSIRLTTPGLVVAPMATPTAAPAATEATSGEPAFAESTERCALVPMRETVAAAKSLAASETCCTPSGKMDCCVAEEATFELRTPSWTGFFLADCAPRATALRCSSLAWTRLSRADCHARPMADGAFCWLATRRCDLATASVAAAAWAAALSRASACLRSDGCDDEAASTLFLAEAKRELASLARSERRASDADALASAVSAALAVSTAISKRRSTAPDTGKRAAPSAAREASAPSLASASELSAVESAACASAATGSSASMARTAAATASAAAARRSCSTIAACRRPIALSTAAADSAFAPPL
mmetsp:Transcript_47726/g.103465  ORF Transcript_47726/g.103465 Transcript_47726/m.103465 type:complete len:335 (+) Transcript_47726:168-1172(+)